MWILVTALTVYNLGTSIDIVNGLLPPAQDNSNFNLDVSRSTKQSWATSKDVRRLKAITITRTKNPWRKSKDIDIRLKYK